MDKKTNETLLKNVEQLSKLTEQEVKMMPAIEAPLPSVEQVNHLPRLFQQATVRRDDTLILYRRTHGRVIRITGKTDSPWTPVL